MKNNSYTFSDGCKIEITEGNKVRIFSNNKTYAFDENNKPVFSSETGCSVMEYSGLATDGNKDKSWAKASFTPESYSQLHYHEKETEIYYILEGTAIVEIDGSQHQLTSGQSIKITPHQKHQVINPSKTEQLIFLEACIPSWQLEDFHVVTR